MHLFDKGWNAVREQIFANQKKLGVIPQDAKLTPWPKDLLKEWDQLTDVKKKLFIRQADVYGAYLAYADHEIGRVSRWRAPSVRRHWRHRRESFSVFRQD
jgi:arylsulfatase